VNLINSKEAIRIRKDIYEKQIEVPNLIDKASGIYILNYHIKSFIFTTDVVAIRNNNADAIMAVYPFTPQPILSRALSSVANKPLFVGVGGGTTRGERVVKLALNAEFIGVLGVVLNSPIDKQTLNDVAKAVEIPVIASVVSVDQVAEKLNCGADVLNVCAGVNTVEQVGKIRNRFPEIPIIATGGPTNKTIKKTIKAGANSIIYTPPTISSLMRDLMDKYRR